VRSPVLGSIWFRGGSPAAFAAPGPPALRGRLGIVGVAPLPAGPATASESCCRVLFIATSGYGFTHSNVEEEHMTVENGLEALKARSEFAKNIYAVADARISAYDSQAGVLVAAAIAVAGFGVASWGRGGLHVGWFIAAALAAVASVLASVNARAVVPKPVSNALKQRLNDSEKAVALH
jgi:hypothetical protein